MKKILLILILVIFFLPLAALAQVGAPECCKAGRDFSWTQGTINSVACTEAAPCNISDGDTIGASTATCSQPNRAGVPDQQPDRRSDQWGMICIVHGIYKATDWIFYILMALVGVMIVIGAFFIITAGGEPQKVSQGRNYILYAVIGMIVAFFAKAIPTIAKVLIGM